MKCRFEVIKPPPGKIQELSRKLELDPIVTAILYKRGIGDEETARRFLYGGLESLYPPFEMEGMKEGVDLILQHIKQQSKILIHGDYDADGVTSTAIMIRGLERLNASVGYYIPDRFDEGYGFSPDAIKSAREEGYGLIITVDCGSSNYEEVKRAREEGLDVLVTDHHEVPGKFPPANVFINAKKPGNTYPFKELSGAGIALKLIYALYSTLGREDWTDFLDLSAIGTIADVVPLIEENRIIAKEGLKALNLKKRPGIAKLLELSNLKKETLSPWDVSFIIAPKINAAGRLSDASVALKFLLEEDPEKAGELAKRLVEMNEERQNVENRIKEEIEKQINENPQLLTRPAWVLGSRGWHQGVIGIVASRFSQQFKRPVFLISIGEDGIGRGSSRCSDNYNVYKALENSGDLLLHYGGHRLAGGFSIIENNIEQFRDRVCDLSLFSSEEKPIPVDAELTEKDLTMKLVRQLDILSPFGEGNPKPIFLCRRVKFQSFCLVGTNRHLKLWLSVGERDDIKGIFFNRGELAQELYKDDFYYDILFQMDIDTWNNQEELNLKIQQICQPDSYCVRLMTGLEEIALKREEKEGEWRFVDARAVIDRRKYIKRLAKTGKKCLILTRNKKQTQVFAKNLQQEGLQSIPIEEMSPRSTEKILVAPFDTHLDDRHDFEEIVYIHPPFCEDHFRRGLYRAKGLKRIHLLFSDTEVHREEANQQVLSPTRERLMKIYKYLSAKATKGEIRNTSLQTIADVLKDPLIQPITVHIALKLFEDLKFIKFSDKNNKLFITVYPNPEKQELENSAIYKRYMQDREFFNNIKPLLLDPDVDNFSINIKQIMVSAKRQLINK